MTKVSKSEQQWREILKPEEFSCCREGTTEHAFSGQYNDFKKAGIYTCICCSAELFSSESKFDSGSGWPSFYSAYQPENIQELEDTTHGMKRVEVKCGQCDAHLGHVFPDGPPPTGLRYCINSVALGFYARDKD